MTLTAKYPGRCHLCGRPFEVGAKIDWDKTTRKSAHAACSDPVGTARQTAALQASRATDAQVEVPSPEGLNYLPYQRAGIAYAMARPSTLIADEMGLGKTIQAIGVINADESIRRVLVVCPASLRLNWQRELQKWLVRPLSVEIANGAFPQSDCVIVNYDILHKHSDAIRAQVWDLLITDECHYLKNPKARRTRQVVGYRPKSGEGISPIPARRKLFLTGTPIVNRPVELWPIVHHLNPAFANGNFMYYAKLYCAAVQNRWGWDFTGSSNLPELQEKLRSSIMIRRLKSEVLTELPPKRRQVIELPANGASGAIKAEMAAWQRHEERLEELQVRVELAKASENPEDYRAAVSALQEGARVAFTEISRLRHETAVAKVPHVIEHINDAVEAGGKLVVFAHHHDVIDALKAELGDSAVVLTGETPMNARQAAVDRFQSDDSCRVFLGSITAAGVGLTLTAAAHVLFAELDWVPGNITQAEDRTHRIGQTASVLIQHLVLEGSLDARMAAVLVAKQEVIEQALDAQVQTTAPELDEPAIPTTRPTQTGTREQIAKEAESLTLEQITAVHTGLRLLAGMDTDYAQSRNDVGYNKIDSRIGHDLAERDILTAKQAALGRKILLKYHRQLGTELTTAIKG